MNRIKLKLNHFFFWWYYKRVPKFFHQWPILKSIDLLRQNYEHETYKLDGLNKILNDAIRREKQLITELANIRVQLSGIDQSTIDKANKLFGTNLKGPEDN